MLERQVRSSMDPKRFDEIVAEIIKCYTDIRRSFEYVFIPDVFEAIIRENGKQSEGYAEINFTKVAVLLQHCTFLYGRKVDYLYSNVVATSKALASGTYMPLEVEEDAAGGREGGAARRGGAGRARVGWGHISVCACSSSCRSAGEAVQAPPLMPRVLVEMQAGPAAPHEEPLRGRAGEPLGPPTEYRSTRRLHRGFLVEELASAPLDIHASLVDSTPPASPLPHQTMPDSAPPPSTPPLQDTLLDSVSQSIFPTPPTSSPRASPSRSLELACVTHARRKRRNSVHIEDIFEGPLKLFVSDEVRAARVEFCVRHSREVSRRARRLLRARAALRPALACFEEMLAEAGGFAGWSGAEAEEARQAAARRRRLLPLPRDDCDHADSDCCAGASTQSSAAAAEEEARLAAALDAEAWGEGVAAAAARAQAAGAPDVGALGRGVLAALPASRGLPFPALLQARAREHKDVSRLLLTVLFLANSGNVEICESSPLSMDPFSVRLVSAEDTEYAAAADAHLEALRPRPSPPHHPPAPSPPHKRKRS